MCAHNSTSSQRRSLARPRARNAHLEVWPEEIQLTSTSRARHTHAHRLANAAIRGCQARPTFAPVQHVSQRVCLRGHKRSARQSARTAQLLAYVYLVIITTVFIIVSNNNNNSNNILLYFSVSRERARSFFLFFLFLFCRFKHTFISDRPRYLLYTS